MSYAKFWTGRWWCREWCCCGLKWQILLSPRYPEREWFFPTCSVCGQDGDWPLEEEFEKIGPPTKVDLTYAPKCSPFTGRRTDGR